MLTWLVNHIIPAPEQTQPVVAKVQLPRGVLEEPLDFQLLSQQVTRLESVNVKGQVKSRKKRKKHGSSDQTRAHNGPEI